MAGNPAGNCRDFDHSPEKLKAKLINTFRLQEFRVNQLEAINATILKENVFVVGDNGWNSDHLATGHDSKDTIS